MVSSIIMLFLTNTEEQPKGAYFGFRQEVALLESSNRFLIDLNRNTYSPLTAVDVEKALIIYFTRKVGRSMAEAIEIRLWMAVITAN